MIGKVTTQELSEIWETQELLVGCWAMRSLEWGAVVSKPSAPSYFQATDLQPSNPRSTSTCRLTFRRPFSRASWSSSGSGSRPWLQIHSLPLYYLQTFFCSLRVRGVPELSPVPGLKPLSGYSRCSRLTTPLSSYRDSECYLSCLSKARLEPGSLEVKSKVPSSADTVSLRGES